MNTEFKLEKAKALIALLNQETLYIDHADGQKSIKLNEHYQMLLKNYNEFADVVDEVILNFDEALEEVNKYVESKLKIKRDTETNKEFWELSLAITANGIEGVDAASVHFALTWTLSQGGMIEFADMLIKPVDNGFEVTKGSSSAEIWQLWAVMAAIRTHALTVGRSAEEKQNAYFYEFLNKFTL